jgi:hypothetical protein
MVFNHMLRHGLFFGLVATGALFLIMITTSPRVWGYVDYPEAIKRKVPPQTKKEKRLAALVAIPWTIFVLAFPVFSTYALKSKLGGVIPFWTAFLNLFVLALFAILGDLVILDWLVVSRITPKFVMIPGTVKDDYRDFSDHYIAHAKAAAIIIPFLLVVAAVVRFL